MHYIHKVGCTSVRQVPVTGTCNFRLTTQTWRDLCLSETQIHRSSDLWVSHRYTCVDPQVTQTHAQPYPPAVISNDAPMTELCQLDFWFLTPSPLSHSCLLVICYLVLSVWILICVI